MIKVRNHRHSKAVTTTVADFIARRHVRYSLLRLQNHIMHQQ